MAGISWPRVSVEGRESVLDVEGFSDLTRKPPFLPHQDLSVIQCVTMGSPPLVAVEQPFPTTVPWKRMIGFEILLLTNTLVILESTTHVVGTGSPSMTRESWGMTAQ